MDEDYGKCLNEIRDALLDFRPDNDDILKRWLAPCLHDRKNIVGLAIDIAREIKSLRPKMRVDKSIYSLELPGEYRVSVPPGAKLQLKWIFPDGGSHTVNIEEKDEEKDDEELIMGGRKVVRKYDPKDWPYPPEPDCEKEWSKEE